MSLYNVNMFRAVTNHIVFDVKTAVNTWAESFNYWVNFQTKQSSVPTVVETVVDSCCSCGCVLSAAWKAAVKSEWVSTAVGRHWDSGDIEVAVVVVRGRARSWHRCSRFSASTQPDWSQLSVSSPHAVTVSVWLAASLSGSYNWNKTMQNKSKTMFCFRRSYMWNKTLKQFQNFWDCFGVVLELFQAH